MKAVYISVPITGRKIEDVKKHTLMVSETYLNEFELIINPVKARDSLHFILNDGRAESGEDDYIPSYGEYIGYDIQYLIDIADTIFFCRGWHESKGCRLEFAAAKIYGKEIMFE